MSKMQLLHDSSRFRAFHDFQHKPRSYTARQEDHSRVKAKQEQQITAQDHPTCDLAIFCMLTYVDLC